MGQKSSKKSDTMLPEELLDMYIQAEFKAMDGVTDNDGSLLRQEVLDLLIMLGYSKASKKLKQLHVKSEDHVELDDYFTAFKADKNLIAKTMKFRDLFQLFDANQDGTASKEEVIAGLEKVDIKVDKKLKETIEQMDANDDGKISYQEFIAMEFKIALNKGKSKKDKKKGEKGKKSKEISKDIESENQKENEEEKEEKEENEKSKENKKIEEKNEGKKEAEEKKKQDHEKIEVDEKKDNPEKTG